MSVGLAIPSIPPRGRLLGRAIATATRQTHPFDQISVAFDNEKQGAGPTRNRAMRGLTTDWVCFLDDDDELRPFHVEALLAHQAETGADVVYPWFDVIGGTDPWPEREGRAWDPEAPYLFPITVLIRRSVALSYTFREAAEGLPISNEDWVYWQEINESGAVISHLPRRTWKWHHDTGNTSGRPDRW